MCWPCLKPSARQLSQYSRPSECEPDLFSYSVSSMDIEVAGFILLLRSVAGILGAADDGALAGGPAGEVVPLPYQLLKVF